MSKLTDTQLMVLSAASQRPTLNLLPMPGHLKGGAIPKVLHVLLTGGLVAELDAVDGEPVWRKVEDGRETRLVLTNAGLAALGIEPVPLLATAPQVDAGSDAEVSVTAPAAPAVLAPTGGVIRPVRSVRDGTKQAKLIAMLKAPSGATIAEIVDATGWQSHTVRGALAGALKKKLGFEITSAQEDRGRVYRIPG